MNVLVLEAALPTLTAEALGLAPDPGGGPTHPQVYVSDRPRTSGTSPEAWWRPLGHEPAGATAWGISSRVYRYRVYLIGSAFTRPDLRRLAQIVCGRLQGRRAPLVAGLEVTTCGDVTDDEVPGVGGAVGALAASVDVAFKADVGQGELASA